MKKCAVNVCYIKSQKMCFRFCCSLFHKKNGVSWRQKENSKGWKKLRTIISSDEINTDRVENYQVDSSVCNIDAKITRLFHLYLFLRVKTYSNTSSKLKELYKNTD